MSGRNERVFLRNDGSLQAAVISGADMAGSVVAVVDLGHFGLVGQLMLRMDSDGARRFALTLAAAADNAGPGFDEQLEAARLARLADAARKAASDLGLKSPEDYIR